MSEAVDIYRKFKSSKGIKTDSSDAADIYNSAKGIKSEKQRLSELAKDVPGIGFEVGEPKEAEPEKTYWEGVYDRFKNLPNVPKEIGKGYLGGSEAATSTLSTLPAQLVGLAAFGYNAAQGKPFEETNKEAARIANKVIFEPRTKEGQEWSKKLAEFVEYVGPGMIPLEGQMMAATGAIRAGGAPVIESKLARETPDVDVGAGLSEIKSYTPPVSENLVTKLLKESSPNIEDVKNTASALYNEVDNSGITVNNKTFSDFANRLEKQLTKEGLPKLRFSAKEIAPEALALIDELKNASFEELPLMEIERLRRIARDAGKKGSNIDQSLTSIISAEIDDFMTNLNGRSLKGKADPKMIKKLKDANELWSRTFKSEKITEALYKAELDKDPVKGIKSQMKTLLRNPKTRGKFSKDELKIISEIQQGKTLENVAQGLGALGVSEKDVVRALMSAGTGSIAGGVLGGGVGSTVGFVVLPTIGTVSKRLAKKLQSGNVTYMNDLINAGRNGREIVRTYIRNTPVNERNAADLTQLLLNAEKESLSALKKAKDPTIQTSAFIADSFDPSVVRQALELGTGTEEDQQ